MKSNKKVIALFAGLLLGFAIAVNSIWRLIESSSVVPGWHTTLYPEIASIKFILSNLALVVSGMVLARLVPFFKQFFTLERMELMNVGLAITGIAVGEEFLWNTFTAWFSGYFLEQFAFTIRQHGIFAGITFLSVISTQLLWIRNIRRNIWWTLSISVLVILGMYLELAVSGIIQVTDWSN